MPGQPLLPKTAPFTSDQITALNGIMAAFTTEQRSWLSGFLAGYQAGQMTGVAAPPVAQAKIPLTILYATESGNAEGVAANARKAAAKLGFAATILDMAEAEPAAVAKAVNLLVIASTWGEGDPPERAAEFYHALMAETAPRFDDVRFAILALGDTAYANFCAVGRQLDARLEALGGRRITERIDCDVAYEDSAAAWTQVLSMRSGNVPGAMPSRRGRSFTSISRRLHLPSHPTARLIRSLLRSRTTSTSMAAVQPRRRSIWNCHWPGPA